MKKEDAIKFLQQLYPNGGHCWLDEQRIEAISMAISALEYKCTEKPVSEELEEAAKKYGTKKHPMTTTGANESVYDFKAGAKWQKERMLIKACEWLRDNYLKYPSEDCTDTTKFVMDFRKYMEGE